ncbi:MAG TPA: HAD-IIIA family hydrolase [Gemmatimonadaceae bacterium]|nr:HAD-IIIA family hydrolase [Gemmatimonadaceae bacterium]
MSPIRPAAFLDRDGTIIADVHHIRRADDVVLLPGAAAAIARLNAAGIPVVVVTNQSGIARGFFDLDAYELVRARIDELLARHAARIDASYLCPHHPQITGPCDCRKPGTLLYRRAADDLDLDAAHSAFVGDRWRDVAPAHALGGRGILIQGSSTPVEERARAEHEARVLTSLSAAVDHLLGSYWRR